MAQWMNYNLLLCDYEDRNWDHKRPHESLTSLSNLSTGAEWEQQRLVAPRLAGQSVQLE